MPDPVSPHDFGDIASNYRINYARRVGTVTLNGLLTVVPDDLIKSTEVIIVFPQAGGIILGVLRIGQIDENQSFTIVSSNALDTAVVGFLIFETTPV